MKKIWIDCTNSPHVLFFEPIINELKKKYEIIVTGRDYQQTIDLLKKKNIPFVQIGSHHGKSILSKAFYTLSEVLVRVKFILKYRPHLAISHQGYYATIAAMLTGRKSLYIFDGDAAKVQMLGIIFGTKALCPEPLPNIIFGRRLLKYPGIKEEVYLSSFKKDSNYFKKLGLKNKKTIFIRPEASSASYIKGEHLMDNLIIDLEKEGYQIVIKGRTPEQIKYYQQKFKNLFVPSQTIDGPNTIANSDLVISGGGTMNREAVVIGTPVVSTFPSPPLSVDKWLVKEGYMRIIPNPTIKEIKDALKNKRIYKKSDKGKKFILNVIERMLN
ncbi:MAG: DUF354 domain-containing protein [Candidatus Woesearchaeota archaeon]|nr:MAG: DUF354 domain-containing protein [Candidatus Woesearchaeota archaeon]